MAPGVIDPNEFKEKFSVRKLTKEQIDNDDEKPPDMSLNALEEELKDGVEMN